MKKWDGEEGMVNIIISQRLLHDLVSINNYKCRKTARNYFDYPVGGNCNEVLLVQSVVLKWYVHRTNAKYRILSPSYDIKIRGSINAPTQC